MDLDGSEGHDTEGFTQEMLQDIHDSLKTYCEVSVSGGGYHFIGRYDGPYIGSHPQGCPIEIYTGSRYFATTGNLWGTYTEPADITESLQAVHDKYIGPLKKEQSASDQNEQGESRASTRQ